MRVATPTLASLTGEDACEESHGADHAGNKRRNFAALFRGLSVARASADMNV
jgi:hypothetical protein